MWTLVRGYGWLLPVGAEHDAAEQQYRKDDERTSERVKATENKVR